MKVTLRIDGEDKTFLNDFVSALHYRKALELNNQILGGELETEEVMDKLVERIVLAFDKQFTFEEFYEGVRAKDFDETTRRLFHTLLGIHDENSDAEHDDEEMGK